MKYTFLLAAALLFFMQPSKAEDVRRQPLKDLNGYFPFQPPTSVSEWNTRKEWVRQQILVSQGLWPMPTKTPLNAVIHGKIDGGDYTIEKVYFESAPGLFVTGNLYKPKNINGKVPGVLFAHGHWQDARLSLDSPDKVRQEIANGGERFENGGRSIFQSLCVQLARMGCIVWQWDMLSDSDSVQFSRELVHGFAKQRPEMNTTENWGLFSPQAEAHAQSIMGLQTWNAVRSLDFLRSLPEIDPERIAMTGASGGGTQTMLLSAIDDRIKLSFPCVMVSTAMQGGCTCENASLLRVNTGNVEFAALFAPKPQGMTTANDWTKEMSTKGFPELQNLYAMLGAKDNVFLQRGEYFPHNYNAVSRSAFYSFLNQHFHLGWPSPVIERDYAPLSREKLTVWDENHPAPKAADPEFERRLLKWFDDDANQQLRASLNNDGLQKIIRPAWEIILGRTFAKAGEVKWLPAQQQEHEKYREINGTLHNQTYGEEVPITCFVPQKWNGRVLLWLDDAGQKSIAQDNLKQLAENGTAIVGANLLFQNSEAENKNRTVSNPREFAGYTFGYNHPLFAQRVHDILTIVRFLQKENNLLPQSKEISLAAWHSTGPIGLAARVLMGDAIKRAAIETQGFRFGKLLDYRDPQFLPAAAKYFDVSGLIVLNAPHELWISDELNEFADLHISVNGVTRFNGDENGKQSAALKWLQR